MNEKWKKAIARLNYLKVTKYCPLDLIEAIDVVIDALSAIDDIKAEIAEYKDNKLIHAERNEMIDVVIAIIDRHIGGKESE